MTYDYEYLGQSTDRMFFSLMPTTGNDTKALGELASNKHKFSKKLKEAKKPMIIVGSEALQVPYPKPPQTGITVAGTFW